MDPDCSKTDDTVPNIDGVDMTEVLLGREKDVRTIVPISSNAIIVQDGSTDWKLIRSTFTYQNVDQGYWTNKVWPSKDEYFDGTEDRIPFPSRGDCSSNGGCLFNLTADPTEELDLAGANPEIVASVKAVLDAYVATKFQSGDYLDPNFLHCVSWEEKMAETNGYSAPVCTTTVF